MSQKVLDFSEKALVFSPTELVSKAAAAMFEQGKHEAIVAEKNNFRGILSTTNLAKRNIREPHRTKIYRFLKRSTILDEDTDIEKAFGKLIAADTRALPISSKKGFYMFTTLNALRFIKTNPKIKKFLARDVMKYPFFVEATESIAVASSIMKETGVSRLPVIESNGKLVGILDSINLLKTYLNIRRKRLGDKAPELLRSLETNVSSIVDRTVPIIKPNAKLSIVIEKMLSAKSINVIVQDKGKVIGIITPRLILKAIGKKVKGVHLTISGLQDEDVFIRSVVDEEIQNELSKLSKIEEAEHLIIHVDKYKESGSRKKYSVKARLITKHGIYFADDHAWDITKAIRGMLSKIEREMIKKKGKQRKMDWFPEKIL